MGEVCLHVPAQNVDERDYLTVIFRIYLALVITRADTTPQRNIATRHPCGFQHTRPA